MRPLISGRQVRVTQPTEASAVVVLCRQVASKATLRLPVVIYLCKGATLRCAPCWLLRTVNWLLDPVCPMRLDVSYNFYGIPTLRQPAGSQVSWFLQGVVSSFVSISLIPGMISGGKNCKMVILAASVCARLDTIPTARLAGAGYIFCHSSVISSSFEKRGRDGRWGCSTR